MVVVVETQRFGRIMRVSRMMIILFSCTFLLMLPAVFNRAPFVYFDSGAYLSQAGTAVQMIRDRLAPIGKGGAQPDAEGPSLAPRPDSNASVFAGRSIYYGSVAEVGTVLLGLWGVVLLQALTLAFLVATTLQTVLPGAPPVLRWTCAAICAAGLALLTPAGFFVSLVMPDLWAGMMILAFGLLMAGGTDHGRGTRSVLGAILLLSALFHLSHLLLLAVLTGFAGIATLHRRWRRRGAPANLLLPAAALVIGLAGHAAFSLAVTATTGKPPMGLPFVTAHLVELGPGTRLARESCPDSGFAICAYVDRLPTDWISFLFSTDPEKGLFRAAPPEVQRAMSQEQARFALATLAAEPVATSLGLVGDGVAQLWHLSVDDVPLTERSEPFLARNFALRTATTIRQSQIWHRTWVAPALTTLTQASTALAVVGLLLMAVSNLLPRHGPVATLLLVCVAGLVLNALICGMLASPYGRFQARVVWLLPFLVFLTALSLRFPAYVSQSKGCT